MTMNPGGPIVVGVDVSPSSGAALELAQTHDALAADGRIVRIRPVEPQDSTALRALYDNAGDRSLYLRFFACGHGQIDQEVRRLTRPAAPDHRVVVAFDGDQLIGVASYERGGPGPGAAAAEFAVLVADAEHGRGIGTLLLEQLVRQARIDGIRELSGDILVANAPMLRVARDLTPGMLVQEHAGVMRVLIPTAVDDRAQALIDLRERSAERKALHPLLAPASIAVVGAGRKPGGVGHEVLCNLLEHGFTGPVYPVNPHADEVAGRQAYPSLAALPHPVDLTTGTPPSAPRCCDVRAGTDHQARS